MRTPTDLLYGTLDLLVLRTLAWRAMHGYAVASWIRDRSDGALLVEDAALYKALHRLEARGLVVLLDDRPKVSPGVAFKDAELIGVPTSVVIGRGLDDGEVELRDRRSGENRTVALEGLVDTVLAEVRG